MSNNGFNCERRSGPVAGSILVAGEGVTERELRYAEVDGEAVFEGDIVLLDRERFGQEALGVTGVGFRWPDGLVPYEIDPTLPDPKRVTQAIAHWENNTRIRFTVRTTANAASFPDFVSFRSGGGCSSMVGKQGGRQFVTLGSNCTAGNAIHEIGHSLGLWHEQSREDRGTFVDIDFANIDPGMAHNFDQHVLDGDDLASYDFGSIMHYPRNAFSTNGKPTVVPRSALPPGIVMGQRVGLSAGDIAGVHAMYAPAGDTADAMPTIG